MSTEDTTLGDFLDAKAPEQPTFEKARYSKPSGREVTFSGAPKNECRTCEQDIEAGIARVLGDNNGCVQGCMTCRVPLNDHRYSSHSNAINDLRAGQGKFREEFR